MAISLEWARSKMHMQDNRLRLILSTHKAFTVMCFGLFGLGAHFASHQLLNRVAHRLALVHYAMDLPANRHVDRQVRRDGTHRTRREHALHHLPDPALRFLQGSTTAKCQSDRRLRD